MSRCRVRKRVVSILTSAVIVVSCGGGDDDGGSADATPATPESAADADASSDDATADGSGEESASGNGPGSSVDCDTIFSMAEMEEFFAEPVEVTQETNDSLGQLVCTWETIEDPDDLEDLAFKLLVVQYYSGSPVPADAFFDPDIYESVTTIEGVGDLAFSAGTLGTDYFFVDEPVGGSLSYTEIDMGDVDAPKLHPPADVEQLFRTFHARVT